MAPRVAVFLEMQQPERNRRRQNTRDHAQAAHQQRLQETAERQFLAHRTQRDSEGRQQDHRSAVLHHFRQRSAHVGRVDPVTHQRHYEGGAHAADDVPENRDGRPVPPQRAPEGTRVLQPEHQQQPAE